MSLVPGRVLVVLSVVLSIAACAATSEATPMTVAKVDIYCTANFDPVCGGDGKTYSNACVAKSEGISIRRTGACLQG